jgi:hypothetical protein
MFAGWYNFYGAVAQAAATLIGLLFVIVTLGAGLGPRIKETARVFVTPTLVHFAAAFFIALLALVPDGHGIGAPAWTLGCGVAGLIYVITIGRRVLSSRLLEPLDYWARVFYAPLPATAYLIIVVSCVAALAGWSEASVPVAAASAMLLVVGIRNAWAMALFAVEYNAPKA